MCNPLFLDSTVPNNTHCGTLLFYPLPLYVPYEHMHDCKYMQHIYTALQHTAWTYTLHYSQYLYNYLPSNIKSFFLKALGNFASGKGGGGAKCGSTGFQCSCCCRSMAPHPKQDLQAQGMFGVGWCRVYYQCVMFIYLFKLFI